MDPNIDASRPGKQSSILTLFRAFIVGAFIMEWINFAILVGLPELIPLQVRQAEEAALEAIPGSHATLHLISWFLVLITTLFGMYALYRLKPWARRFNLIVTIGGVMLFPMMTFSISSGWALVFDKLAAYMWAAALAIAYFSPIKNYFVRKTASNITLDPDVPA
jgi:hypothetical protein